MSAGHIYQRANEAACNVDPYLLSSALDHIARSAAKSRSQTRRIRWIQARAEIALRGEEYRDIDLDLPKSAGPDTNEKLQRRMAYHIAVKMELAEAASALLAQLDRIGMTREEEPLMQALRAAIAKATGAQA